MGIAISLLMGALGVLQNTLNKQFSSTLGLPVTLLVNGFTLCACSLLFFFALRMVPAEALPEMFRPMAGVRGVRPYDVLPGIFGFVIISSLPWVLEKQGATKVFIAIIAGQLVVSMLWDLLVEGSPVDGMRAAGAALALIGAIVASL
jgi:bacterial/archaeal transporter family-2 protein